jgi:hypothetical protein
MKATNEPKMSEVNSNNDFDALCLGFEGGSYILEDFFQNTTIKPSIPVGPVIDWFGLYNYVWTVSRVEEPR